jgi:hypothetical protein
MKPFDVSESIASVRGGFGGFWGRSNDKLHITKDALVLVRKKRDVVGHASFSEIISLEPKAFFQFTTYIYLAMFLPYLIIVFAFKNYFELRLSDGTTQILFIGRWRRAKWLSRLSEALEKSDQAKPAARPQPQQVDAKLQPMPVSLDEAKSLLERLEQLGRLQKDGVLTTDEFKHQKQRILTGV